MEEVRNFDEHSDISFNTREISVFNVINILGKNFTIYGCERNPLFLARDVAEVIDYSKTSNGKYNVNIMLKTVPDNEKLVLTMLGPGSNGGPSQRRKAWFVTENGLYTILMQSRKPLAIQFQEEVKKILWTLRRTGVYANPETIMFYMEEPEELSLLIDDFKKVEEERNFYQNQILDMQGKVDYYNQVMTYSDRTYTMKDLCEQLGLTVSYKEMYDILCKGGYMYRSPDRKKTYFRYEFDKERYTVTIQIVKENPKTGKKIVINKRRWTEAGKYWIYSIALANKLVKI